MNLDRELIVRAQHSDTIAQEEWVRALAPMVFRVASRFFRTREDVEDLAQEIFSVFSIRSSGSVPLTTFEAVFRESRSTSATIDSGSFGGKKPRSRV